MERSISIKYTSWPTTMKCVYVPKICNIGYVCIPMLFYHPINMSFANHFRIYWMLSVGGMLSKAAPIGSVEKMDFKRLWFGSLYWNFDLFHLHSLVHSTARRFAVYDLVVRYFHSLTLFSRIINWVILLIILVFSLYACTFVNLNN